MRKSKAKTTEARAPVNESFVVTLYQLVVGAHPHPKSLDLYIQLRGTPEYPKQKANYGELYFVDDNAEVPRPSFTENAAGQQGLNRVRIFFWRSQYAHLVDVLRRSRCVRCYCYEFGNGLIAAGLKDWNTRIPGRVPVGDEAIEYIPPQESL